MRERCGSKARSRRRRAPSTLAGSSSPSAARKRRRGSASAPARGERPARIRRPAGLRKDSNSAGNLRNLAALPLRCRRAKYPGQGNAKPSPMPYRSLRDFIERLENEGQLVRVKAPVSPFLEMTEIQTRLLAEGGPAVLFENVVGPDGRRHEMPVLVNLFGTVGRVALGMERRPDQLRALGETLAFLKQPEPPGGWREALDMLPMVKTVMTMRPKTVGSAACQEIVWTGNDIDLAKLPIQTCWPGEPAPLITWPLVVTQGPNPGGDKADNFNLGIYRMQVTGRNT